MMFTAVGGGAGTIGDTTSLLPRGFAMASTDTGHEIEEGNAYLKQPEALLDYAYRGVHLATQATKRIIAHYYGREVDRSYLQGCSNGGRAALLEAERFPDDYDGIIAGAPAFRFHEFPAVDGGGAQPTGRAPADQGSLHGARRRVAERLRCRRRRRGRGHQRPADLRGRCRRIDLRQR